MNYRPPVAPFALEPLMYLGSKRFHGLQLTYDGEDALGYRPKAGHRPPDIELLMDLVASWHEQVPNVNFIFPCSFPEMAAEGFADSWLSAARRASIEPSRLELGLDPVHLPNGGANLVANLTQLREAGVGICQLDFGTGYATMATWRQVPLTRIEIPPSFFESQDASATKLLSALLISQ